MATYETALRDNPIGDANDPDTTAALRRIMICGTNREQGIGFYQITGYGFPSPEAGIRPLTVIDSNEIPRFLSLNSNDGRIHEIVTRNGPENSGFYKARRDNEGPGITITGITLSSTQKVRITAAGHGLSTGDYCSFRNIKGTTTLNNEYFEVLVINTSIVDLVGTNSSNYSAWTSGGEIYRAGIAIAPKIELGEDTADSESKLLRMQKIFIHIRPELDGNRGQPGYDSNGYPDGLVFRMDTFKDGERTTASVSAKDITLPKHHIQYDKITEANRLKSNMSTNAGEHSIIEIHKKYVATDIAPNPDGLLSSEQGYQSELAQPSFWIGCVEGIIKNRILGETITIAGVTVVSGPDGNSNTGMRFSSVITLPRVVLTSGTGEVWCWYKGTINLQIGLAPIPLTVYKTSDDGWILGYAKNIVLSDVVTITPTGSADVADIRMFDYAMSAGALEYDYNDIIDNNGLIVL